MKMPAPRHEGVEHLEARALRLELIEVPCGQGNGRHDAPPSEVQKASEARFAPAWRWVTQA